jgi:PAS domain S-box-containing protein
VDLFSIGLQVAFAAVFVVVLVRYLQDPRPVNRDLMLVAGSVAAWFAIATIGAVFPSIAPSIARIAAVFILVQPVVTLFLVRHFAPVGRNILLAAIAWYVISLAIALGIGTRGNPLAATVVVGYFVIVETFAAVRLAGAANSRVGYARSRLWVAAIGTVLFAATVFVTGAAAAASPASGPSDPSLVLLSRLLAFAAGLSYLVAFMPPQPLRKLQQRATAFDFGQALFASPDRDPHALWLSLAETALHITGGRAAIVATGTPPVVRAVAGEPPSPVAPGDPGKHGERPADGGPPQFAVPITAGEIGGGQVGTLTVVMGGESLFVEDDRVLLTLLAEQAARSADRQEAILERIVLEHELEDRSHELAESQARLDEEARFRVALEAHPGILLVVDPDGRIGYANAQALQSLRYVPDEIRKVSLRDLLATAPALGLPTQGVQHAEARRRDGTIFPVDFAISTFDLGGNQYSIAVLTDISERLQTERLRDTFIGMLSHELRTPVTSIYGGSQVLMSRGDRLDPETRHELITDVASEAERLHRLIENLLVLARVERGQDLAGGEPVLLQRILPLIVERERALWPGTTIEVSIPPGLPTVRGHDGYVGQVVQNLLSNAAKYAGAGAKVQIVASRDDAGVSIHVLDDGAGILPEHAEHLFDLYYRAPGAADRAPGAGIGLFVCRHIVTALGGTIWARSRPEGGAEFGFELPIYEPDDEVTAPPDRKEPGVAAIS